MSDERAKRATAPLERLLEAEYARMKEAITKQIDRPLIYGTVRVGVPEVPRHGPHPSEFRSLGEDELGVEYLWDTDCYRFTTPGYEAESVYLTGEQVDALIARLAAHRNRTLYR